MRIINGAIIALFASLFVVGCSDTPEPAPVDTVLGAPTAPGNYSGWGDDVNPYGVGGGNFAGGSGSGDGLTARGGSFGAFGAGGDRANTIGSIYFGFDQFSIRPSERAKIEQAARYIQSNPSLVLILEGHTDSIGTTEYNLGLSDRRANSVKSYLEQLGVPSSKLQVLPMGMLDATPGVTRNSPQAEHDRRVDIIPAPN